MRFVFLTHSLVSDWNHGNAHFQRGLMRALGTRGHETLAAEPAGGWSRANLAAEIGQDPAAAFEARFPGLAAVEYASVADVEAIVQGANVVVVHEWTEPAVVAFLGRMRARGAGFQLWFHDTHHRAVSAPDELARYELDGYDGVLAFGAVLADVYRRRGWGRDVHVWHEAADVPLFRPMPELRRERDLVWIGNWGDGERTAELDEYLFAPARALGLSGAVHGVRYPDEGVAALRAAGLDFAGRIANWDVPSAFARARMTVHVPRRPYVAALPGIPTIRVFEALACGIPLVSAPWEDVEGLFSPGEDYLVARDGAGLRAALSGLLRDPERAAAIAARGRQTVLARHTCAHRADELLGFCGGASRRNLEPADEGARR